MTTLLSAPGTLESLQTMESGNRVFTPEQVQANLLEYEVIYPELFATLDQLGLGSWPYTSPFTGNIDAESFQNARLQTGMVVFISEKLADELLEAWSITQEERDSIIRSAVLHNSLKHLEILWKSELPWTKAYSEAWHDVLRSKIDEQSLRAWKSDIEVASMMRKVIGHGSLKDFVIMKGGVVTLNPERTLPEMIVHIASDMVWAKNPKFAWYTPDIQVSNFVDRAVFADFPQAYPFLWEEWITVSDSGVSEIANMKEFVMPADGHQVAENYYRWQERVYEMICRHIQSQVAPESHVDPTEFVVNLVNKSHMTVSLDTKESVQGVIKA